LGDIVECKKVCKTDNAKCNFFDIEKIMEKFGAEDPYFHPQNPIVD